MRKSPNSSPGGVQVYLHPGNTTMAMADSSMDLADLQKLKVKIPYLSVTTVQYRTKSMFLGSWTGYLSF